MRSGVKRALAGPIAVEAVPSSIRVFRYLTQRPICNELLNAPLGSCRDHHHGVAGVHQAVQHANELFHVSHMQADSGFVEHVKRALLRAAAAGAAHGVAGGVEPHLGEFGHQLDALRFAAGERGALLAEGEVAEADVLQQAQRVAWRGGRRRTPPLRPRSWPARRRCSCRAI